MTPSKNPLDHPISRLGVKHGDMTLGEVAKLNEQLEQEIERLKAEKEKMAVTVKDTVTTALALEGENSFLKDQVRNLEEFLHSRGTAKIKKQLLDQRTLLRELAEALKRFVKPSHISGPLYQGCACKDCQARAALARAEEVLK